MKIKDLFSFFPSNESKEVRNELKKVGNELEKVENESK